MKNIRNFCIIAHIDHGKIVHWPTACWKRPIRFTEREMQAQVLDNMDLEREKGITIKSHAIQMEYLARNGEKYVLNLIDTPGHVDFSYEVSRAIASCEGALLVVDATQGIQAQTISNLYLAVEHDLKIIPVLNKIDMDSAMIDEVKDQVVDLLGCDPDEILCASGKTGLGVEEVLEAIVERIPEPQGDANAPLQALIFDSVFNPFRGIIAYFRVFNGTIRKGEHVKFFNTGSEYDADEVGVLKLKMQSRDEIRAGDVGYICSGIKTSSDVKVGDTITSVENPSTEAIAGFEDVKPMVFAGVYPVEADQYEDLRASLEKLQLNDASLTFEPESSLALGFGFRCGFLGLLHMEIIQERLYREFDMDVITTVPNVSYKITTTQGDVLEVHNPSGLPEITKIASIEEPYILAQIITKSDFLGNVLKLCIDKRGIMKNQTFITQDRVEVNFEMPLSEIVFDFYDKLKSISKGYASFDYHRIGFRPSKLAKLDILLNGEPVDALSSLIYADHAYDFGRRDVREAQGADPAPTVRHRHPGSHRRQDHRPRNGQGRAQGRDGQMLRRRHLPKAQAAGKAEKGQETHASDRQCRSTPVGLSRRIKNGLAMKKTIIDLFESSVEKYGKKTFLLEKRHHAFQPTTYAETREQALEVGAGLASLGIRPKDKVAILAEGSNGWIISELGIFYAGAISVPLSVKLEESNDLLFRLRHAEVKALFVSKQQLPKIRRIRAELPELEQIIVLGHIPLESGETAYGMLKRLGRDYLAGHKEEFLEIGQAIRNDDYATITYTSGTTADPKGVVLTHRNYTANVEQSLSRIDIPSSYRTLIILPLDHCFAHVVGFYIMIACGASGGDRTNRGDPDGDTQEYSAEYPRSETATSCCRCRHWPKISAKTSKLRFGPKDLSLNGCSTSRSARPISTIRTATTRASGWRILLAPVVGLFDARAVPQGAGGIRRQPGVLRRGRRTARFGAATLFLCHRDPDVPGIRTFGSDTRHFDQFAQVPLAQVRIVGQDSRYRST